MTEAEILAKFQKYAEDISSLRLYQDNTVATISEADIMARFETYDKEIKSLRDEVNTLKNLQTDTKTKVTSCNDDLTAKYKENKTSI